MKNFSKEDKLEIIAYVKRLIKLLVEAEDKFIDLAYSIGDQEGMTSSELKQYIRYLANLRLQQCGYKHIYDVEENPLPWMDWVLSGKKHTNFFEEKVTDYSHEGLKGTVNYERYQ